MPLPYQPGDKVRYTGPVLLGQPITGTVMRLPTKHVKGKPRHATEDRVMVLVSSGKQTKHAVRPIRPEHLEKIR